MDTYFKYSGVLFKLERLIQMLMAYFSTGFCCLYQKLFILSITFGITISVEGYFDGHPLPACGGGTCPVWHRLARVPDTGRGARCKGRACHFADPDVGQSPGPSHGQDQSDWSRPFQGGGHFWIWTAAWQRLLEGRGQTNVEKSGAWQVSPSTAGPLLLCDGFTHLDGLLNWARVSRAGRRCWR